MTDVHDRTFSYSDAWTAICIYEWFDLVTDKTSPSFSEVWDDYRGNVGSCELRDEALRLAPWVNMVTAAVPEDVRDGNCFDWEVVPSIMELVQVNTYDLGRPPLAEAIATITDKLSFSNYLGEANHELKRRFGIDFTRDAGLTVAEFRDRFWPQTMSPRELADWWAAKYGLDAV